MVLSSNFDLVKAYITNLFTVTTDENQIILISFFVVLGITIFLRILVSTAYQTQIAIFSLSAKELGSSADVKDTKSRLLNKIINDFVKSSQKGIANINLEVIVSKHMVRLNTFGWSLTSIDRLVESIEFNMVVMGVAFSVLLSDKNPFIFATIIAFLSTRIFASIFDIQLVKSKLKFGLIEYVEREVGQFFIIDTAASMYNFRREVRDVLVNQSDMMQKSMGTLGTDLTETLGNSMNGMTTTVEKTIKGIEMYSETLKDPIAKWSETIKQSEMIQKGTNNATDAFQKASQGLQAEIDKYVSTLKGGEVRTEEYIEKLIGVAGNLLQMNRENMSRNEAIESQLEYVKKNQNVLDTSLQQYQATLENMTKQLGDSMGKIVDYNIQKANLTFSEQMENNLTQIMNSNNDVVNRLQKIFEQIYEQNKSETQIILGIKEQMDMYLNPKNNE